ncbi:BQ2448_4679 [Microbotryum intermedium]|uniref:DASH complex subunit DAD4 n=1 Tax=Microbotryum intermedium TaxID=269621 RepID=A0A238FFL0_9BASI|nr:BQ2448_4679 [Microbotryum intermedium]
MENPYEEQQQATIARILSTVAKLNESMLHLNRSISANNPDLALPKQETNTYNVKVSETVELWTSLQRGTRHNLESTGGMHEAV